MKKLVLDFSHRTYIVQITFTYWIDHEHNFGRMAVGIKDRGRIFCLTLKWKNFAILFNVLFVLFFKQFFCNLLSRNDFLLLILLKVFPCFGFHSHLKLLLKINLLLLPWWKPQNLFSRCGISNEYTQNHTHLPPSKSVFSASVRYNDKIVIF